MARDAGSKGTLKEWLRASPGCWGWGEMQMRMGRGRNRDK